MGGARLGALFLQRASGSRWPVRKGEMACLASSPPMTTSTTRLAPARAQALPSPAQAPARARRASVCEDGRSRMSWGLDAAVPLPMCSRARGASRSFVGAGSPRAYGRSVGPGIGSRITTPCGCVWMSLGRVGPPMPAGRPGKLCVQGACRHDDRGGRDAGVDATGDQAHARLRHCCPGPGGVQAASRSC